MNQVQQTNPFLQGRTQQASNAVAQSASDQLIAEVQGRMVIAKKFPRDQVRAMDAILLACQRPTLAEGALYSYARGGQEITGASIRLAEAMAQAWGNIDFGIRELSQANGESTVEAYAWDLETNTRQSKIFQVPHKRFTRQGTKDLIDPRDIYELVANNGARRLRACILGVIPGDVQETAVRQCEETLKSTADTSPENIKKMLTAFADFGVTQKMIEAKIQRRIDTMTPAQMVGLKKNYQSLKDGMASPSDLFDVPPGAVVGDSFTPITDDQKLSITKKLKSLDIPESEFCRRLKIESLAHLPAGRFNAAMGTLNGVSQEMERKRPAPAEAPPPASEENRDVDADCQGEYSEPEVEDFFRS